MSAFLEDPVYQPIDAGDVIVSATLITDHSLRRGYGRLRQLASDLSIKAHLHTHHYGIVGGLGLSPAGVIYAMDAEARRVTRFDTSGRALPHIDIAPGVGLGSIIFLPGGGYLAGEHLCGNKAPYHGGGAVYRFDDQDRLIRIYKVAYDGGMPGFLGVTHMALAPDGRTLRYVSETGARVMQYDLEADQQMDDFYVHSEPPGMVFGLCNAPNGDLIVSLGSRARRLNSRGDFVQDYSLPPGRGWATLVAARDGESFWAGEFFDGGLAKVRFDTGEITLSGSINEKFSLAGIVEMPA